MSAEERKSLLGLEEARRQTSSDRLKQAQRVLGDTEELGMGILGELRNQRETLDRAKGRLESTDTDLAKSTRTLRSMAMRARANKVVTAGIAVAVLVALLVILAWSR